tara:strand:+ start:894 stop:1403 length:510 start_codon:yes stop_codon:yes gene_type:complete
MVERIPQGSSTNITDINVYIPELPLAGFGFLAHFVWEMLQVPWFIGMADAPHGSVVGLCLRATGGDVLILLASFWLSSIACGNRRWLLEGVRKPAVILVVTALVVTIVLEWLATGPMERWVYADSMPIIPLLGVGLAPVLQWLLLPPLIMWLARRHMLGHIALQPHNSG